MNSAVRAQLSEKERKQLGRALKSVVDWKRPIPAIQVWSVIGIVLAFFLLTVGLAVIFPLEISDKIWQPLVILVIFVLQVVTQRNYALIRRLHDIAAAALEDQGEGNAA